MSNTPFAQALTELTVALEHAGIRYFVGGSIASVLHGEVRTTHDVDIVVDLRAEHVAPLTAALAPTFFAEDEALRWAIAHHSSCNIIHRATALKIDLFLLRRRAFSSAEMDRRCGAEVIAGITMPVATAEDCVLTKLEWFRKGGEVSDRQWRDVLGVLHVKRGQLDEARLDAWAERLGVADLLERAREEAGD